MVVKFVECTECLANLRNTQGVFKMTKLVFHTGFIVCLLLILASCTVGGGDPVKQRYTKAMSIRANETGHPQYSSRVIGEVFINMGLSATNQYQYSGEPPFLINMGIYSLAPDVSHIKILSAEMFINNGNGIDIIKYFPVLEIDTDVSLSRANCGDCGHYGSKTIKTDYFISAAPIDDDHVKIIIKIEVDSDHVGEVEFNFVPQVLSAKRPKFSI